MGAQVSSSPRTVVETLISGLGRGGALYTLGVINASAGGGHAVTPYAVERLASDRYAILVYDNNFPRKARKVLVNTKANTWSYRAALNPRAPASLYTGNADSGSLLLLPTRPGLGVQPCPFCMPLIDPTTAAPARAVVPATAAPARARGRRVALQAIRLQTSGPVGAHLRITDASGRRIGFVRGRLVNEIPGARIVPVFVDGPRTWRERIEPQYEVPTGKRYRIELTAGAPPSGPREGRDAAGDRDRAPAGLSSRPRAASPWRPVSEPGSASAPTATRCRSLVLVAAANRCSCSATRRPAQTTTNGTSATGGARPASPFPSHSTSPNAP